MDRTAVKRIRSGHSVAVAVVLLVGISAVGLAQGKEEVPLSPAPSGDLASALLVASDLPSGMISQGVKDATDFDIDTEAFTAHEGIAKVDQTWTAPEQGPVAITFDFRFLFPDPEAAQAYLDDAEEVLSERDPAASGLTLVPDAVTVGDVSRHYAGSLTSQGVTLDLQNFLVRDGPVVAKVFVGGFDTTAADALPIAQAADARIRAYLAGTTAGSPVPGASVAPGATLRQWASGATASTEYAAIDYAATQATGAPDVESYRDDPAAWAPSQQAGTIDWLELTYDVAVVPVAVNIVESSGAGFVTTVEAFDDATSTWTRLWAGHDPSPDELTVFSPPLGAMDTPTRRLRITIDTETPGWNEVDAVELVGTTP